MKNTKNMFLIGLALVLVIVIAGVMYKKLSSGTDTAQLVSRQQEVSSATESSKNTAPDFTVYDKEGNKVNLSDYFGKPIVLNFWASWCGPCRSEMPDFNDKYLELKDEIIFLMVNMTDGSRETVDIASDYVKSQGFSFEVLYDTDYNAANTYQVYSLPTTYFLDSSGNIAAQARGAISSSTLQNGIDMIK